MKKNLCILMSLTLAMSLSPVKALGIEKGKVDLYDIFSKDADKVKTQVGSALYKWTMHLPEDAIIYKSDKSNFFNMTTNSYSSNVQLMVNKNNDELSLEDILYKSENKFGMDYEYRYMDKQFATCISKDQNDKRYVKIIKGNKNNENLLLDESGDELMEYVENRIYIENGYIYNYTLRMNGEFYKNHVERFEKLISSFKLQFDSKDSHSKELSESVSTIREFSNTSYGWNMNLSSYWKLQGIQNSKVQKFSAIYDDTENGLENINMSLKNNMEYKIQEGISVKLVSSAVENENSKAFAQKEIENIKNNINSEAYELISSKEITLGEKNSDGKTEQKNSAYETVTKYKTVTKMPSVVYNLYVVANGYKYLITATMTEEQYKDTKKRKVYEDMIYSFKTNSKGFSKYIGKITSTDNMIDYSKTNNLKMKNYNFSSKIPKYFSTSNESTGIDNGYYMEKNMSYSSMYEGSISNREAVFASDLKSNIKINMAAGLDTTEMKGIISQRTDVYAKNDEVRMGLANVNIKSASYNDSSSSAEIYCIEKIYDVSAIDKFVKEDSTKKYDLSLLENEYEYIVKTGKDVYVQTISIPVFNMTEVNKKKISDIISNTTISDVNYSNLNLKWKKCELSEFKEKK